MRGGRSAPLAHRPPPAHRPHSATVARSRERAIFAKEAVAADRAPYVYHPPATRARPQSANAKMRAPAQHRRAPMVVGEGVDAVSREVLAGALQQVHATQLAKWFAGPV